MGDVYRLPEQWREFIADGDHSKLRATWHRESGLVVISLWRDEVCVATSHLTPAEAARLSAFITNGLADLATDARGRGSGHVQEAKPQLPRSIRLQAVIRQWRQRTGRLLESVARRLGR